MKKAIDILNQLPPKQAGAFLKHLKVVLLTDANAACLTYAQQFIDQHNLMVSYVNISAGVGCNVHDLFQLHRCFEAQGVLTLNDIRQIVSRGIPLHFSAAKLFGINIKTDTLRFGAYLQCIEDLTQPGGQFYNLVQL